MFLGEDLILLVNNNVFSILYSLKWGLRCCDKIVYENRDNKKTKLPK